MVLLALNIRDVTLVRQLQRRLLGTQGINQRFLHLDEHAQLDAAVFLDDFGDVVECDVGVTERRCFGLVDGAVGERDVRVEACSRFAVEGQDHRLAFCHFLDDGSHGVVEDVLVGAFVGQRCEVSDFTGEFGSVTCLDLLVGSDGFARGTKEFTAVVQFQ